MKITIISAMYEYNLGEWHGSPIAAFDADDVAGIEQFIKDKEEESIVDEFIQDRLFKFRAKWYKNNPQCVGKIGLAESDKAADEFLKSIVGAKDRNYYYRDFAGNFSKSTIPAYGNLASGIKDKEQL